MAKYINKYTNIEAYNADDGKQYPNVSYLVDEDVIKWVKENPYIVVCKYNVTSTSEATFILNSSTGITYQIIDDVKQDTVKSTYTFDTLGEHTVKYKLDGTSINNGLFSGCSSLTSVTIPDIITSIDVNAFGSCSGLTCVTIPNSVTLIGLQAFYRCSGLTSVTIPNSVTLIDGEAFIDCTSLTSVTIPNSVIEIGRNSFYGCSALTSVTIKATTPPALMSNAFTNTNNCPIYVPADSLSAYVQAGDWGLLVDRIQAIVA